MPFRRKRIIRRTMGKDAIKKSFTLIDNIGNGSPVGVLPAIIVPGRNDAGGVAVIRDTQNTSTTCNVGDVVKYVNFIIQVGARSQAQMEDDDNNGWLEWAVVFQKENVPSIPTTNLGVKNLGMIAMASFRGDCLMTGQFPVGTTQPMTQEISIKIPKTKVKLQLGSSMILFTIFRSVNVTDLRTDSHRAVVSTFYKNYV